MLKRPVNLTFGLLIVGLAVAQVGQAGSAAPRRFTTPKSPSKAKAGDVWVNPKDGMEFVYVPAGEFTMGSTEQQVAQLKKKYMGTEEFDSEHPQHKVALDAYWIGKYEVTNAQFEKFIKATGYTTDFEKQRKSRGRSRVGNERPRMGGDKHPVVWVSWNDAAAYCKWAGGRLPTEAEWEKAARGADARIYPWGNQWDASRCNTRESKTDGPTPVGRYPKGASPYGCHDMVGNLAEWCADWFDKDYYRSTPRKNPSGPKSGQMRVVRGGAWGGNQDGARAAYRGRFPPATTAGGFFPGLGFRAARSG